MFPVRPGEENYLSGTMGELRSSHFHTGLDIKTSGVTGLPVHAAADGYVQRARVSIGGYGNALYLAHPQHGRVTVYAHLKGFDEGISKYVRASQYNGESFEVDLYPGKDRFVFKKGDVIARSGNSGSSSGPHLHFEIRDLKHRALDPLDYGFDEIVDDVPPVLAQVAFVTMDKEARVNGMYGRIEFEVKIDGNGNAYVAEGISLFGNIGVEVYAYDKLNGARNRNGVRFQAMLFDGKPVFSQRIDRLGFGSQRDILAHTNYKRSAEGGRRFNKLYVDHGNGLGFYGPGPGQLRVYDPIGHRIDIRLEDAYGNINQVSISVNGTGFDRSRDLKHTFGLDANGFDIMGHTLEVESKRRDCPCDFYVSGKKVPVGLSYYTNTSYHFLWDLRDGLPDSANVCDRAYRFGLVAGIPSGQKTTWKGDGAGISFPKFSLFDTVYLQYQKIKAADGPEIFAFNNPSTPLRQFVTVRIKPEGVYDPVKSGAYAVGKKGGLSFAGGKWEGGELVFKTRDMAPYTVATDSIPPTVTKKTSRKGRLMFKIEDAMSGIRSVRATLDGEWLLMVFDAKSGFLWSDDQVEISGGFSLSVKDHANNITRFEATY